MTMELKYIMIDKMKYVLFCHAIQHVQMRDALAKEFGACNVTSAGFVEISDGSVYCFGRSESLDIDSDPVRDAHIISRVAEGSCGMGSR